MKEIEDLLTQFNISGQPTSIIPHHVGHLHNTYEVTTSKEKIALQKINHQIFKDVPILMQNIDRVTKHLRNKKRTTLSIVKSKDGELFVKNEDGSYWRAYLWIEDSYAIPVSRDVSDAFEIGKICAEFLVDLSDLSVNELSETIPEFQNCEKRLNAFNEALIKDPLNRAKEAKDLITFIESEASLFSLLSSGQTTLRIVHNDPKVTNVLFSSKTDLPIALVDLDTCMPGSALYDFGDLVRNLATLSKEDEADIKKVIISEDLREAVTKGFLENSVGYFNEQELHSLPKMPKLIALNLGTRFLTDYILGDKYFTAHYSKQNFIRARNQLALAKQF